MVVVMGKYILYMIRQPIKVHYPQQAKPHLRPKLTQLRSDNYGQKKREE